MAPYLFWEFIILIIGVWVMAVLFFVYGWLLLKRQKQLVKELLSNANVKLTDDLAKTEVAPAVHLEISKDEPIGKYKDVAPEDVEDVSFVDKNE